MAFMHLKVFPLEFLLAGITLDLHMLTVIPQMTVEFLSLCKDFLALIASPITCTLNIEVIM